MKIENFALDLHSESSKSSSSTVTTFTSELQSENSKRLKEAEAINAQVAFCKRLEFELIQQLIFRLNPKPYKFKAVDASEFTNREVSVHKEYRESQSLDVSMGGFIYTSNRRIEINIDISMSHSFVSNHEIIRQQFYDPLVLNFDGELPDLGSTNFSFDIDANGECDPIFNGLRIWQKTKDEDLLLALGEVGIGAIYLSNTNGKIDIKNERNETLGRIRATGLFLNENGTSGIMSQIDFARQNSPLTEFLKIV